MWNPDLAVAVQDVYLRAYEMQELVTKISHMVAMKAQSYLLEQNTADVPYMIVDLPVTLFMIKSSTDIAFASQVARKLPFAPAMQRLADKVLAGLAEHLRHLMQHTCDLKPTLGVDDSDGWNGQLQK